MAHARSDTPTQALPGEDGSANTSVPTQALPGIIYTAEITFYIATDAATDVAKVVIYERTTLGEVLSSLIGPPGDGFSWGAFLTDPVPDDTIRDGIPDNTRIESSYFGRLSNNPRINMRTLLLPLVQRHSQYVVVHAGASNAEMFNHRYGGAHSC